MSPLSRSGRATFLGLTLLGVAALLLAVLVVLVVIAVAGAQAVTAM